MQLKQSACPPWKDEMIFEIPRIEFYPFGDMNADDYMCELWIPIRENKK